MYVQNEARHPISVVTNYINKKTDCIPCFRERKGQEMQPLHACQGQAGDSAQWADSRDKGS